MAEHPQEAEVLADPARLAAALRNAAHGIPTDAAAAELVCTSQDGHWLRSEAFRALVSISGGDEDDPDAYADVLWPTEQQIREMPHTTAEKAVLWVASQLAAGWFGTAVSSCDAANVELILDAIGRAAR